MDMDLVRQMAAELGVSKQTLDPLRHMPFEQAVEALDKLKTEALNTFKKVCRKYHPDHNQDRSEWAHVQMKALLEAKKAIESLRVQPPMRRRPVAQPMRRAVVYTSGATGTSTTTSTGWVTFRTRNGPVTVSAPYNAIHVVNMRPV